MSQKKSLLWLTFRMPLAIGIMTAIGLFSALLGDGRWDAMAWTGLAIPAVICVQALLRR